MNRSREQYVKTHGEKDAIFDLMKQGPEFSRPGILTRYVLGNSSEDADARRRRCSKRKIETLKTKTTIFRQAQTTNKVKDEVNVTDAKQITRPTPYASCDDFRRVFDEDMNTLYQLAFLLTADHEKAMQCFVSGLDDVVKGNPVFKEWARSWARRAVILNAVRVINPRPSGGNGPGRSSSDAVDSHGGARSDGQRAETAAVLNLEPFERFVYVIAVLERCSDQEGSVLLGCTRRDVAAARTSALQQIGRAMEVHHQQLPSTSEEMSERFVARNHCSG
jgi:hypothetical protein